MMRRRNFNTSQFDAFFSALGCFILLLCVYPQLIFNPNDHLFAVKGDGLKNYFHPAYYIKYNSSLFSYEGMNYPFGESLLMVDSFPVLSFLLRIISRDVIDLSAYTVGILNVLMIVSLAISAFFLQKVFRHLTASRIVSILGAIGISLLSSQAVLWKFGHYALSLVCFFPVSWWLLLCYEQKPSVVKGMTLLINMLFWYFIHGYLGIMISGFYLVVGLFYCIKYKTKARLVTGLSITILALFSTLTYYLSITLPDQHLPRDQIAYTTAHKASKYSLILPGKHNLFEFFPTLNKQLNALKTSSWDEVGTYLGMGILITLLILFVVGIRGLISKGLDLSLFKRILDNKCFPHLFAAFLLLLFAMAIPFRFGLAEMVPQPLGQLVGLGRFAWPFYVVCGVLTLVFAEKFLFSYGKKIALVASVLIIIEGVAQHISLSSHVTQQENILLADEEDNVLPEGINRKDFQAIIPLPFYHKYGKKNEFEGSFASEKISMQLAYATGLPLMSALLSRPSSAEAKDILSLFTAKPHPELLHALNDKAILVIHTGEVLNNKEKEFLQQCSLLTRQNGLWYYRLNVSNL